MRYSILGFNQNQAVQAGLDLTDLLLLQYIMVANGTPEMKHITKDDVAYVWLSHDKIQEDLPILGITEGTLRNKLANLKKGGWIISETIKLHTGTNTYYSVSTNTTSLINDVQTLPRHSEMTCPRHSEMTSNNILIDNKLDSNSTNVELEQPTVTPHRRLITDIEPVKKPAKKKNLYESCREQIIEFAGDNERLRDKLIEWLGVRLERRDTPFGAKTFASYLKKLAGLSSNADEQIKIIQQAIDKSHLTFYPLSDYNKYKRGRQDPSVFSEFGKVKSDIRKDEVIVNVQY